MNIGYEYDITEFFFKEMMKGAYVILNCDHGHYYINLKKYKDNFRDTSSSHKSCNKQYEIRLTNKELSPVMLVGTTLRNSCICTWFQIEKTSVISNLSVHLIDYLTYLFLDRNIGPLGNSFFTEKNPLLIYRKNK